MLAAPYWRSEHKWKVRGATLLLALLTVAQVGLSVWGNYWNRALFDALEARSVRGVVLPAAIFALIFVISMAVTAAHLLVKRWLQLDWRAWLTDKLIGRWMEHGRHYRLLFSDGEHDNPDQRIAEDIRIATDGALGLSEPCWAGCSVVRSNARRTHCRRRKRTSDSGCHAHASTRKQCAVAQYIAGVMSLGALMQAAQAFQRLTSALSWPVDNAAGIAICRASAERVLSLYEDVELLDAEARPPPRERITVGSSGEPRLVVESLAIGEPSGQRLAAHLNIEIRAGERVLVTGDSAVTSRFFKVIAGLWPWGSGRVLLPDDPILFLPQRPYLPEGTLRDALCYPRTSSGFTDATIRTALEHADIGWIVERLDTHDNWEQVLPLRAQQRLAFARR